MSQDFGQCPQCRKRMIIENFLCWHCGTSVRGKIAVPLLARLDGDHTEFIKNFLLGNGSLTQVQTSMKCSYPKARRLLNETMASIRNELETMVQEQKEVLKALEEDSMDPKEAIKLIRSLASEGKKHERTR